RDVWLVATDPLHVPWSGTFVSTPEVSRESGTVNIKTEVANDSTTAKKATVRTQVLDPAGQLAAQTESTQTVPSGQVVTFDQKTDPIASPKLWHPDHPYLYSVKTTILDDKKPVDEFTS